MPWTEMLGRKDYLRVARSICTWVAALTSALTACTDERVGEPTPKVVDAGPDRIDALNDGGPYDTGAEEGDSASAGEFRVATRGQRTSLPALGPDGTIYSGSWDGRLYAINPTGTLRWTYATEGRIDCAPVVAERFVYVSSWDGTVYAIDTNGSLAFRFDTGGAVDDSVALDDRGTAYVASQSQKLFAFDAGSGSLLWSANLEAAPTTAPAIDSSSQGVRILVGTADGNVHTFNPLGSEAPKLTLPTAAGYAEAAFALASDGSAYAGTSRGHVIGIHANGSLAFDRALTYPEAAVFSPVVSADGRLFVGSTDRTLYALTADGALEWSKAAGASILSSATLGSDGNIYVGANGLVRASPAGALERVFSGPIDGAPVFQNDVKGGVFYANTLDGAIVSGHLAESVGLASAPWPTAQGGYDRRGLSRR